MHKRSNQQQKYYFSDRLKRQLALISHHPLTIVEAPSGFGKTTAVREYLKENLPHGSCQYWYTCLGEPASMAWMGICELFSNVNVRVADDLKNLKMPTIDTLFHITLHLRDVHCQKETYLVVDNYQLVNCDIPRELISFFSMHGNHKLHMIFITQQLENNKQVSIHNNNIHTIDAASFFFDREGTGNLFRMEGIRLAEDELEKIFMSTEGWISAIRLQMMNFIETGSLDFSADIEQLVEEAIWNSLKPEEKDFLLSVSVLDSFTMRQAAIMLNKNLLPEKYEELLKNNDFIRCLPDKYLYTMHRILHYYLRNRFYNQMPENYQKQIFRKAAEACAAISQYYPAAEFFYKVRDFEAILSLPFNGEYLYKHKEKYQWEFIVMTISECPEETLCKYPFTMIVFGYYMLMNGQDETYIRLCKLLHLIIQTSKDFNKDEIRKIHGEYMLLVSLGEFNDISKMTESLKISWDVLGKPTDMIKNNTPWMFASPSVLNMLWRQSGKLENVMQHMEEGRALYRKLARGHGAGACYVIQAEAMLMRGEDEDAEILCHKALYDARSYQQTGICLCAELVLAFIAVLRGDGESFSTAIKNIRDYSEENPNLYIQRMAEHCMSVISLLLGIKDYVAPWLYDIENIKKVLYGPVVPFAQILHLRLLLMDKRYNEFYGICQLALDMSESQTENTKYMMSQVSQLILLAVAKRNNGNHLEAQKYLREALDIALPDQIYLPFAQQECMEDFLSELNISSFDSVKDSHEAFCGEEDENPDISRRERYKRHLYYGRVNSFASLKALCRRQQKGIAAIKKVLHQAKSPLTPREREIARLARERLSAKEIPSKLYISEMTVRATLRNVYIKLDIHSKSELSLKEF